MKFLKDNLFLAGTLVVLAAGMIALLVIGRAYERDFQVSMRQRVDLSRDIAGLVTPPRENPRTVNARRREVQEWTAQLEGVIARADQISRPDYKVMVFPGGTVAFPIDQEEYSRRLRLLFPELYKEQLVSPAKGLLALLEPASPPTAEEIKKKLDDAQERAKLSLPPAGRLGAGETGLPERPEIPEGPERPAETTRPADKKGPRIRPLTAEEKAREQLAVETSRRGKIYASEASLHVELPREGTQYPDDALWLAQVGLWVQGDIASAIRATNNMPGLRTGPDDEGVPGSAVKRLVRINVRGYVVQSAPAGRLTGGAAGPAMDEGPAPPMYLTTSHVGPGDRMPAYAMGDRTPPLLTGRACDKLYDVVHYDFTVVMPTRYVMSLYHNLLTRNLHTILDVQVGEAQQARGSADATGQRELYYYGTDPVVQVTIVGELLLLADWTRGRWNAGQNKWDAEPLMPALFLQRMGAASLRPEDVARAGTAAAPGGPPGP